jgi:hypothetical protein
MAETGDRVRNKSHNRLDNIAWARIDKASRACDLDHSLFPQNLNRLKKTGNALDQFSHILSAGNTSLLNEYSATREQMITVSKRTD